MRRRLEFQLTPLLALAALAGACSFAAEPLPSEPPQPRTTPSPGTVGAEFIPLPNVSPCTDPQPPPVVDFEVRQLPELPEPPARQWFRDPVFGTCLVRVTDRLAHLSPDDPSPGMKNEYSRVQSFNADGTRILVMSLEAYWYLYDARTLEPLGRLGFSGPVAPRWDAHDPDVLYYSEETRLMGYDIPADMAWVVHDFATDFPGRDLAAVWTRWEGSPSFDGRYWGLMAEDRDWLAVALLIYDQEQDRVIARRGLDDLPAELREIDSVSISPMGNYFVAYFDTYCEYGELGTDENPCGVMVYDRDLSEGRGLVRVSTHSDLALNAKGEEVMIFDGYDTDSISLLNLATGAVDILFQVDFSRCLGCGTHYSGRALRRPGWALVSTHDGDPASYSWMEDQVFAVELRPGGAIIRLAHTHSLVDPEQEHDYWAEPQATVDQDFTHVLFTSNWGRSGTGQVEMFLVVVPQSWTAANRR